MQCQRPAGRAGKRPVERMDFRDLRTDEAGCIRFQIRERARARLVAIDRLRLISTVRPGAVDADIRADVHYDGKFWDTHFGVVVDLRDEDLIVDVTRVA